MECPACSSDCAYEIEPCRVYRCCVCGCLFGEMYRGESYSFVRSQWCECKTTSKDEKPFDLMILGSDGLKRRHGWYHALGCKGVTQVG